MFFFISLLRLMSGCESRPEYEYFYSQVNSKVVTKMNYNRNVYFINGFYHQKRIPNQFITPVSGLDNSYICYIYWKGEVCYLLSPYGKWEVVGDPNEFIYEKIDDIMLDKIMKDTTGKYIYVYGNVFPD
jgi:hypothetical protein